MVVIIIMLSVVECILGYLLYKNSNNISRNASSIIYNEIYIKRQRVELEQLKKDILSIYDDLDVKGFNSVVKINRRLKLVEHNTKVDKETIIANNMKLTQSVEKIFNEINQLKRNISALSRDDGTLNRY
tara:strand:- start:498 stop:884 length:387 start_codon:yes stop_codon:yes gene_type:complete